MCLEEGLRGASSTTDDQLETSGRGSMEPMPRVQPASMRCLIHSICELDLFRNTDCKCAKKKKSDATAVSDQNVSGITCPTRFKHPSLTSSFLTDLAEKKQTGDENLGPRRWRFHGPEGGGGGGGGEGGGGVWKSRVWRRSAALR